eukprot:15324615-Ditylum_brightwellii.AAC.1
MGKICSVRLIGDLPVLQASPFACFNRATVRFIPTIKLARRLYISSAISNLAQQNKCMRDDCKFS